MMSGLVPASTAEDDFYYLDPKRHDLVGPRTRRLIRLSDKLTVQVAKVDSFQKQVDFRLAEQPIVAARGREESNPRGREQRGTAPRAAPGEGASPRPIGGRPEQRVQYRPGGRPDYT